MKLKPLDPLTGTRPHYFHGTSALAAVCIAIDGFLLIDSLLRNWYDGALGEGIYITASLSIAAFYTRGFVIQAQLASGTRILRLDEQYDPRVIDSLRKEFGNGILQLDFEKSIPANKQLRGAEIVHLLNYLWVRGALGKKRGLYAFDDAIGSLRRYLAKFHYAAMGCPDSDIGIVVFNPSRLVAVSIALMPDRPMSSRANPPPPSKAWEQLQQAEPSALAIAAADDLRQITRTIEAFRASLANEDTNNRHWTLEHDRKKLTALLSAFPRWQSCLRRYCEKFHLSIGSPEIAAALSNMP